MTTLKIKVPFVLRRMTTLKIKVLFVLRRMTTSKIKIPFILNFYYAKIKIAQIKIAAITLSDNHG